MATPQENLARFQEIARRGLQDQLEPDKRARFDEAVRRGLVKVKQPEPSQPVRTGRGIGGKDNAPGVVALLEEAAAAVNRGALNVAEFFTTDQINALYNLFGGEGQAVTPLTETELGQAYSEPQITEGMTPGLGRDIVRGAGEMFGPAAAGGAVVRQAAKGVKALRPLAGGDIVSDATTGAITGAGAELGEEVGGDAGRVIGTLAAAPAVGAVKQGVSGLARKQAANAMLKEASPTVSRIKQEAQKIYQQLDDSGVTFKPERYSQMTQGVVRRLEREGFDVDLHPKVAAVVKRLASEGDEALTVTKMDTLRKVASNAARSPDPSEARLGGMILDDIDDFVQTGGNIQGKNVGRLYKDARGLWQKARKTELIESAIEKAKNQASGFENGLRTQFRQILNNKKKTRGFTETELDAMRKVVRGDKAENIAKHLGKFGFSEGQAGSMLLSSLGVAGGAAVGGAPGAVAIPVIGQSMRKLAQVLTNRNAELARRLISAGNSSQKIAQAYVASVPKSKRSVEELTGLLLKGNVKLEPLKKSSNRLFADAAYYASIIQGVKPLDTSNDEPFNGQDAADNQ